MKRLVRGFTLIQVMIVLAIIGILTSILATSGLGPSAIYGYTNSKEITGRLESVTSAMPEGALVSSTQGNIFQASVLVKLADGQLTVFSTEDRQWASLLGNNANGKCVTAKIFPYAPWQFSKGNTYYGGRLITIKECH